MLMPYILLCTLVLQNICLCNADVDNASINVIEHKFEDDDVNSAIGVIEEEGVVITNSTLKGGLYIQLSQSGINFICAIVEKTLSRLLQNATFPGTSGFGFSLDSVTVDSFTQPEIDAHVIPGHGVNAVIKIEEIQITGQYVGGFIWTYKGAFLTKVQDFRLEMNVTTKRRSDGKPKLSIPNCQGHTNFTRVIFAGGYSTALNAVRGLVETYLASQLDEHICDLARLMVTFFEQNSTDANNSDIHSAGNVQDSGSFDASVLCGLEDSKNRHGSGADSDFSLNATLEADPVFVDDRVIIPMDGGITFRGTTAFRRYPHLDQLETGTRMVTIVVTDHVPNTFFSHVHHWKLAYTDEKLSVSDFPSIIRTPINLFCWGCSVALRAGTVKPPKVTVTHRGVALKLHVQMRIIVNGPFKKFDLVNARLALTISMRLFVHENTLKGDMNLANVDIYVENVGLGGVIGRPMHNALKFIVPKQVWPRLKRRLRFALAENGLRLPVLCGLQLHNTNITYVQNAAIIDTDIKFDLEKFLEKFKEAIQEMNEKSMNHLNS